MNSLVRRTVVLTAAVATALAGPGIVGGGALLASAGTSDYKVSYASLPDGANKVIRWDPCLKITYRVNLAYAAGTASGRAGALADVKEAVSRLSRRTGITFIYEGGTTQVPNNVSGTTWWQRQTSTELVVSWVDRSRSGGSSNLLGKSSSGSYAAGTGGNVAKTWSKDGSWNVAAGRGFLVLDAAQRNNFRAGYGSGVTRGALLLHELGHVLGLGHVTATSEIMYPTIRSRSSAEYFSGDRTGLTKLGRPAGCIGVPTSVWPAI